VSHVELTISLHEFSFNLNLVFKLLFLLVKVNKSLISPLLALVRILGLAFELDDVRFIISVL
jgi:hypothetical protein